MNMNSLNWGVKELKQSSFYEEINNCDYPILVEFWANWCPPCRMMEPLIESLADEYKEKCFIRKVNTDLSPSIAQDLNVSGVPCIIIFNKGNEIWRKVGAMSKKSIQNELDRILAEQSSK